MSKALRLYNSFTRTINQVKINGEPVRAPGASSHPIGASFYICGPTVYSHSHLGHAITYTRADLFRRFMKSIFNVELTTVMNITDIDDKILQKALDEARGLGGGVNGNEPCFSSNPAEHPFRKVSELYHRSFLDDMDFIRVKPPDISIKVSQQINLIVRYIQRLEEAKHAYIAPNGDIYFKVATVDNYVGRTDARKVATEGARGPPEDNKQDERDFVLWKAAKPNEPVWHYKSPLTGQLVPGRPGWHVQCSAISSAIFGHQLDFHFGGKDLIFPHHYNEQACCCAYHQLDTSASFHAWSNNWLHSGHLVLRNEEKMSKSLGNVVGIREFINSTSVNALRLLCIASHYRADVNFDDELLQNMRALDHKISAFSAYLSDELRRLSELLSSSASDELISDSGNPSGSDIEANVFRVYDELLDGACDDFDLDRGLQAILELSKRVYNTGVGRMRMRDIVAVWHLLADWCSMCGLEYGALSRSQDENLVQLVREFRDTVRQLAVNELKAQKRQTLDDAEARQQESSQFLKSLLNHCDRVRSQMDDLGYVIRDSKT